MKRRTAIKGISILTGSIILAQGCSDRILIELSPDQAFQLNQRQANWIEVISEAILPKEDKTFTTYDNFPNFVSKMIPFNYKSKETESFIAGYNACTEDIKELYNSVSDVKDSEIVEYFKKINELTPSQPMDEESQLVLADKKFFCNEIRNYAIKHLQSSKEYQEEVREYALVPGFYNGCVSINN